MVPAVPRPDGSSDGPRTCTRATCRYGPSPTRDHAWCRAGTRSSWRALRCWPASPGRPHTLSTSSRRSCPSRSRSDGRALHVALAGVLMFLCGRAACLTRAGATLAAIGSMLSERVLIERIHPPYLFAIAWLPAVFLAAGRVGSEPGAWRGAVLGAAVECLLLAGYPELVCFTAYSLLLLLLVLLVIRGVPAWSDLRRLMVAGLAAGATACALGAVQLLPTLELAGWLPAARGGGRRAGSHVAAGFRARRRARARRGRGGRAGVRYLAGERSGAGAPRRERSLLARLECHRGR